MIVLLKKIVVSVFTLRNAQVWHELLFTRWSAVTASTTKMNLSTRCLMQLGLLRWEN